MNKLMPAFAQNVWTAPMKTDLMRRFPGIVTSIEPGKYRYQYMLVKLPKYWLEPRGTTPLRMAQDLREMIKEEQNLEVVRQATEIADYIISQVK
jgi:hypothetical protein